METVRRSRLFLKQAIRKLSFIKKQTNMAKHAFELVLNLLTEIGSYWNTVSLEQTV